MEMEREQLLREVMAADFYVIELNLYLNTHPCDQKALMCYNSAIMNAKMLREKYEMCYGPLTPMTPNRGCTYQWIEGPWPWQRGNN